MTSVYPFMYSAVKNGWLYCEFSRKRFLLRLPIYFLDQLFGWPGIGNLTSGMEWLNKLFDRTLVRSGVNTYIATQMSNAVLSQRRLLDRPWRSDVCSGVPIGLSQQSLPSPCSTLSQARLRTPIIPSNLNFTGSLTIAENQPIGAIVGDFNSTDPDAGPL